MGPFSGAPSRPATAVRWEWFAEKAPEMAQYEVVDEAQYFKFEFNVHRSLSLGLGLRIPIASGLPDQGLFRTVLMSVKNDDDLKRD